jgi:hypothetical protein
VRSLVLFSLLASLAGAAPAVVYLSDLEGDAARMHRILAAHERVRGGPGAYALAPDTVLVHGGDTPDRGPGSLEVRDTLLALADRHPGRVLLCAGNRDVNKLRLVHELGERPTPRLLRTLLADTMNASRAFEFRQQELRARALPHEDADVVASYLEELTPGGAFHELLRRSRLVHRVGGTLFVHGSVTGANFGRVPGRAAPVRHVDTWVRLLNRWFLAQLDAWAREVEDPPDGRRPGDALLRYVEPAPGSPENAASVVYSRGLGEDGLPALPDAETRRWLRAQGVWRVVVGHTPAGDTPLVVRAPDGSFEVVRADHSRRSDEAPTRLVLTEAATWIRARAGARDLDFRLRRGQPSGVGSRDGPWLRAAPLPRGFLGYRLEPGFRVVYSDR